MVKLKIIKDVIEELELANEPYVMSDDEKAKYIANWESSEKVILTRGVDDYAGKWLRITKYDHSTSPPRRFILDSVCGWKEFFKGDSFGWTSVFRQQEED